MEKETAPAATEAETRLMLHVIEQGIQSILLRDKYLRVFVTVQTILLLILLFK